jgi:hypothetical protein
MAMAFEETKTDKNFKKKKKKKIQKKVFSLEAGYRFAAVIVSPLEPNFAISVDLFILIIQLPTFTVVTKTLDSFNLSHLTTTEKDWRLVYSQTLSAILSLVFASVHSGLNVMKIT